MMATIKYNAPNAHEHILTTELNAIAEAAGAISAALSNDAAGELDLYMTATLYLDTMADARHAGANVALYVLPEVDAHYSYGAANLQPPAQNLVGVFAFDAAVTARYSTITGIPLPPTDFYLVIWNNTGHTFAATGNILDIERYSMQSA
jgi:hypothetical protein